MNEPIHMGLRDIYRATDVKRWGIVKTAKAQSVAEHSFQVAMITARLCQLHHLDAPRTQQAVWLALTHDLPEVLTGDIATPLKNLLGPEVQARLQEFEGRVRVAGAPVQSDDEQVRYIVKCADLLEAIAFLHQNALTDHGQDVLDTIIGRVRNLQCPATWTALAELCEDPEVTLDSVLANEGVCHET